MRLEELDALTAAPELWNDAARAQKLLSEKNSLEESVTALKQTETSLNELSELCELAEEEGNRELVAEIITQLEELKVKTRRGELEALLSGEADKNDAFLEVHAGSGGTEAQDWAEMLLRMYTRWAEAHQYKVEYVEEEVEVTDDEDGEEEEVEEEIEEVDNPSSAVAASSESAEKIKEVQRILFVLAL